MGIYAMNRSIVKYIEKNKNYGFDDLMIKLIKKKIKVNCNIHKGYWLDVGRPSDYQTAQYDFNFIKKKIL